MNPTEIFKNSDEIIEIILLELKKYSKILNDSQKNIQRITDLKQGLVFKNGIYIPLKLISHKILFDGYENQFLITFIVLYENIFKEKDNLFTEFAIRTLTELGFPRAQILFSKILTKKEKQKYKLLHILADYGFIAFNNKTWLGEFKNLYSEFKNLLTPNQQDIFIQLLESIEKGNFDENNRLVKLARKLINSYQDELFKKTPILPIFRPINIESANSAFSHILHGNILLLENIFSTKKGSSHQHILRIRWSLLLTGMNVLKHVSMYLSAKEIDPEIYNIEKRFTNISNLVKSFWEQIES